MPLPVLLAGGRKKAALPNGYNAWLTQASTFGTITSKEKNAVLAVFAALNAAGIFSKMYQLYLMGGDDAAFGTAAARRGKRGLNVIAPAGTALTYSGTAPNLNTDGLQWGTVGAYADSGLTGAALGVSSSNFGFFEHFKALSASPENVTGMNGAGCFFAHGVGTFQDYWGNPPAGSGGTLASGDMLGTYSTTSVGTGIRTYRNGSLVGSGVSGAAVPSFAAVTLTIAYVPASGGNNHNGIIHSAGSAQALDATENLALNNALKAYATAIA